MYRFYPHLADAMRGFYVFLMVMVISCCDAWSQQTYALLVGVGNYMSPANCTDKTQVAIPDGIKPLRCPENDIQLFRSVITQTFAFANGEPEVLLHEKATRNAVADALRSFAERCNPGDVFIFYYSGHGAQVKNSKSKEADGLDEVILPYDAVLKGKLIRDKELRDLFAAITAKGAEVVAIFDCCHSGSMTRDVTSEYKSIPNIETEMEWYAPAAVIGDADKLVVLSAARSDELAMARSDESGRVTSLFTQSLVAALKQAKGNEAMDELMIKCQQHFDALKVAQHPVMDATSQRRKRTLNGKASNETANLAVQQLLTGKRALVYGSDVLALHVGALVNDSAGMASATVVRVVSPTVAEIQFADAVRNIPAVGTALRIESLDANKQKLKVYFSRAVADGRAQEFAKAVDSFENSLRDFAKKNPAVLSLADSSQADYIIHLAHTKQASSWVLERIHGKEIDAYPAESRSIVCDVNSTEGASRYMQGILQDLSTYLSLLHMRGSSDYPGELVVTNNGTPVEGSEAEVRLNDNIQVALRLKDGASQQNRRYVYVVGLSQNGSSALLFPLSGSNAENYLPLETQKPGDIVPLAEYHVSPPTGVDHLLLLALDAPLSNPYLLEQPEPGTRSVAGGMSADDASHVTSNNPSMHCSSFRLISKD